LRGAEELRNGVVSILLAVVLALGVGLIGCAGEYVPEIGEYSLVISAAEGGDVSTPGGGTFAYGAGEVVSLVAVADDGYRFVNWTGDVGTVADVSAAETTIIMNGNCSILANFHEIPATCYTLTLAASGNGSTSPPVGQHTYAAGTVVPITAFPANGYWFVIWTGSTRAVANVMAATTTITVNADCFIAANFEEGVVTVPGAGVGPTVRGPIKEGGYIFPSDVQRHTFFTGTT
jgi:hypothetical protein